jgi:transposase-like protein
VLDLLVQSRRHKRAAKRFFRKLLKGLHYVPRVIVTDKLRSDGTARKEILPGVEHREQRYLNNRAEFRTSRHGSRSGRCVDSSHRAKPNVSFLLTAPSPIYFVLVVIG